MSSPFTRLSVALVILGIVLGGYGVWYRAVSKQSERAVELALQIDEKTAARSRTTALRAALGQLASDEALVRKYFVSSDTVVAFLEELQKNGTNSGALVEVLSVSTENDDKQATLRVVLGVEGSFSAVMNTVGRIEYAPYDLSVRALSVQSGKGEEVENRKWNASMTISIGSISATSTKAATETKPL